MSARFRRASLLASTLVALGLVGVAIAWACTPSAGGSADPSCGGSGTSATIGGSGFRDEPVNLYWNHESGPLLATTRGPGFSVRITIPADAREGTHHVVLRSESGQGYAPVTFVVSTTCAGAPADPDTGSPAQENAPSPSPAREPSGLETDGAAIQHAPSRPATSPSRAAAPGVAPAAAPVRRRSPAARTRPSTAPSRSDVARRPAPARQPGRAVGRAPRPSGAPATAPRVTRTASGQRAFSDSLAVPDAATTPRPSARARRADAEANPWVLPQRSPDAATARPSRAEPSVSGRSRPSLTDEEAPAQEAPNGVAIGMALLAIGLTSIFAGFLVAEVRRRRAVAGSSR